MTKMRPSRCVRGDLELRAPDLMAVTNMRPSRCAGGDLEPRASPS